MSNSTVVTLRLPTEIYTVVRSIADKDDIPVSFVIRRALKKGLGIQQSATPSATQSTTKADEIVEAWE